MTHFGEQITPKVRRGAFGQLFYDAFMRTSCLDTNLRIADEHSL